MFLIAGSVIGIAGVGSLVLLPVVALSGALQGLRAMEYWMSIVSAVVRNILMSAAGYASFHEPNLAPELAWAALSLYVASAVGYEWLRKGQVTAKDFTGTFFVTALFIAVCAGLLTGFEPTNA